MTAISSGQNASETTVGVSAKCRYLDWDSEFFGLRIARYTDNRLSEEALVQLSHWCNEESIDCLYFLADGDDELTVRLAELRGFRFVDIRITLDTVVDGGGRSRRHLPRGSIRQSAAEDLPALQAIARVSHRQSRFYFDSSFASEQCDALYGTWIEKSCAGFADVVLVSNHHQQPTGYVTCHLTDEGEGAIGLLGVAPGGRGKGIGTELLNSALDWFSDQHVNTVTVVTQGRNISAQRLYQRNGFRTQSSQLWYHLWFQRDSG